MQLWYAPTSPFARKVRIAAHELGLSHLMALERVDPWTDMRLRAVNPLAKVPTLVLGDGQALYESNLICDWLDEVAGRPGLFPVAGPARWRALLLQGLADGAMTAAGRLYADEHRPSDQRSDAMMQRLANALAATLESLEQETLQAESLTIGEVTAAALLGYLDFRWPERDWRSAHPRLGAWFGAMERRPSLAETAHHL